MNAVAVDLGLVALTLALWALTVHRLLNLDEPPNDPWGSARRIAGELQALRERRERPTHWPPRVTRRPKLAESLGVGVVGEHEEYVPRQPLFTWEPVRWWLAWGPDTFPVGATHRQAFDRDIPLETAPSDAPGLEALANRMGLAAEARLAHDPDVAPLLGVLDRDGRVRPVMEQADGDPRGRVSARLQDGPLPQKRRSSRLDIGPQ